MTQEELKDFILSRITLNKEYWKPRLEKLFQENPNVTREVVADFFEKSIEDIRNEPGSVWTLIYKRGAGELIRIEEAAHAAYEVELAFDEMELSEFLAEMSKYADQFRSKAIEAFNSNDRYTCAIYYTLYAISLNKELKDIYIKRFLMERVFIPLSKITPEITLEESQKKDVVNSIFDRSSVNGFGRRIASLDFRLVENDNLPFKTESRCFTFFDFIGACKDVARWPDIRKIW